MKLSRGELLRACGASVAARLLPSGVAVAAQAEASPRHTPSQQSHSIAWMAVRMSHLSLPGLDHGPGPGRESLRPGCAMSLSSAERR
jgi:hypothetical protein